jgi:hypothetical protein
MRYCKWVFAFLLGTMTLSLASTPAPDTASQAQAQASQKDSSAKPSAVTMVRSYPNHDSSAGFGNFIEVSGLNLDGFLNLKPNERDKIRLFIDGLMIPGSEVQVLYPDSSASLLFRLSRDSLSNKGWSAFYQAPRKHAVKRVAVSAGYEGDKPLPVVAKAKTNLTLVLVKTKLVFGAWLAVAVLIGGLVLLAWKTPLLRDAGLNGSSGPFSLSRVQLAYWTAIVSLSFLYIWATTGDFATIAGSTLLLLGISLGTTAAATVIDKNQDERVRHQDFPSEGFIPDILSDANGLSMHRFQMFVWNIIMGVIFITDVYRDLSMPQFSDNLLMLMGVSSGAYVVLKVPENKSGTPEAGKAPAETKDPAIPPAVG